MPRRLRRPLYGAFARRVGAEVAEAERPLEAYASFDEFFTRHLAPGLRPVDARAGAIVSPCDGTVAEVGTIDGARLMQAKGIDYKLETLVPDADAAARFDGGTFVTLYLAPKNYHRVHAPVEGRVTGYQHVPGAVFPVNDVSRRNVRGLYSLNERLITFLDGPAGEVAVVMVAATGVGHMTVTYDAVATRRGRLGRPGPRVRFAASRPIERGGELGTFHLGSTVVLLFEPNRVELVAVRDGDAIRLGEAIGFRRAQSAHGGAAA
ncbi:MAG TPA: archaetidylserine decarboxylase [Haliangiales bacterium]|nr:archaetidylserine decarboxylase [Haliangiales bacterium]